MQCLMLQHNLCSNKRKECKYKWIIGWSLFIYLFMKIPRRRSANKYYKSAWARCRLVFSFFCGENTCNEKTVCELTWMAWACKASDMVSMRGTKFPSVLYGRGQIVGKSFVLWNVQLCNLTRLRTRDHPRLFQLWAINLLSCFCFIAFAIVASFHRCCAKSESCAMILVR